MRADEGGAVPGMGHSRGAALDEIASKDLKPDDVRIHGHATGVNFADSLMLGGTYQVKPPFPFTPASKSPERSS